MKGTSSKKYIRPLGPKQKVLAEWFRSNPSAEFSTNQIRDLGVVEIPKVTGARPENVQSYISERLASLVERGVLYRRRDVVDGHQQYSYGYLNAPVPQHTPPPAMATTSRTSAGITITLSSGAQLTEEDVKELLAFMRFRE